MYLEKRLFKVTIYNNLQKIALNNLSIYLNIKFIPKYYNVKTYISIQIPSQLLQTFKRTKQTPKLPYKQYKFSQNFTVTTPVLVIRALAIVLK